MANTPAYEDQKDAVPTSPASGEQLPQMETDQEGDEISLLDLALVAADHLRLLVLGPLAVGVTALGISFLVAPTFTAKTLIMPPQQQQSAAVAALQNLGALAGAAGAAAGVKSPSDQYVALLQSTTVEDRLIERFKLMDVYEEKYRSEARKELEKNTRISAGKKDNLITIEVDDRDPQRAADLANAYVEELKRLTDRLALTEAQQRRQFFEKQLAQTKNRLVRAQQALQGTGFNEGAMRAEPKAAAESFAKLRAEVTAAEVRVQAMRGYLTETAPEYRQAQNALLALRAQLSRMEGSDAVAEKGDYVSRFREFKYQETLFDLLVRQLEAARLDESREGAVIQVVDLAAPPERKSKPRRAMVAVVATLAAGFALLLWVFVRRTLRNARQDAVSAQKLGMLSAALRRSVWLRV